MTITEQSARAGSRAAVPALREARVRAMRWEAEGVMSLEFELTGPEPVPSWRAGAHLDVVLPDGVVRQYSLCSRPAEPWAVAVLHDPASRGGSRYIHEQLRPGTLVSVRGPKNNFALEPAASYRFLAGGIGITPILAMVREAERAAADWQLDYLGRSRRSMAFIRELEQYGSRVRIHADDADGTFDLSGHLAAPAPGQLAYACGPAGLLGVLEQAARGWPEPDALRLERFVAAPATTPPGTGEAPAPQDEGSFAVELPDGAEIQVPADRTILQALEDAGYAPLNSCREGICGTCETPVLAGAVDHRDTLLSDAEKEASQSMMICVSRAAKGCPRLKLEL